MTATLMVLTKLTDSADTFETYWSCGRHTQGVVKVTVHCETESKEVAAELSALQYLLEEREVCGTDRAGNSMQITCSFGAVRKLASGKSDKASLAPFALFLRTRFADAQIAVSKDSGFIHSKAKGHAERLIIDAPRLSTVSLPDGLAVGVTHHALVAYMTRYQNPVAANAWRALRAAMANPGVGLRQSTLQEESHLGRIIRVYENPDGLRLIVAIDKGVAKLVTCYYCRAATRQ